MTEGLHQTTEGRVRVLTFDRPDRKNALSRALLDGLVAALDAAEADGQVGVVVLTGAGGTFSSGADLKEMGARDADGEAYAGPFQRRGTTPFERIVAMSKPVLAAVEGPAVAAGFELALACDIRVLATSGWFASPEARRGLGAQFASVVLPRRVPAGIAAEWLFTGRRIPADEALRHGLANVVTEDGAALSAALELAGVIAANAPLSLGRMKRLVHESGEMGLAAALRHQPGPDPYTSEDRKEGVSAFLQKRPPVWSGR